MKRIILLFLFIFSLLEPALLLAQNTLSIKEVRISTYLVKQLLLHTPSAASIVDSTQLKLQATNSFIPALNAVAGVRMEERSPGSYRLSLRGSLLRSPFGVRNVKIYLDEFPLTDAGGNTYINSLAMNGISKIEILKGPDGSLFGANSGGVLTLLTNADKEKLSAEVGGGSYGAFKENISFATSSVKNKINFTESYQQADGYRDNSAMKHFYLQAGDEWKYNARNSIKALVFYSDLQYQTPGGLTAAQYSADPAASRPATPTIPGASQQKAAIYNKMAFGGITHTVAINNNVENVVAIFASTVDLKNPFITNYEVRKEDTYGARTFFIFSNKNNIVSKTKWEYDIGAEWQQTRSDIHNYTNNAGTKGTLMAAGDINSTQDFIFNRLKLTVRKKIIIEAGLSINFYKYVFKDSVQLNNIFKPQWMPRLAVSYLATDHFTLRGSVSRGYSAPTTAEIRPSDNNVYKDLQAETGTNIEFGARYFSHGNRFWVDLSLYNYQLHNAIVNKENAAGGDYFVNAGGTKQNGLELQVSYQIIAPQQQNKFIKRLQLNNSSTINHFKFKDYIIGTANYSGNFITGVPERTFVSSMLLELNCGIYLFIQYDHTSSLPVNDANTVYAKQYDLVQLKAGRIFPLSNVVKMEIYAGIDNLLNQHYSLGNDLNAAGNRFFNAAPLRNYFAGIIISK